MRIELCAALQAACVEQEVLDLPQGSTVREALAASAIHTRWVAELGEAAAVGVWGKKVRLDAHLHEGDRLELYRSLRVDPKVARRERFQKQGTRSTGLFAKRRPGAKPGY
jgi:putative ubiquitin-RnfH superfamily antitoxin RatB of RatAB toxin-antitoxin module